MSALRRQSQPHFWLTFSTLFILSSGSAAASTTGALTVLARDPTVDASCLTSAADTSGCNLAGDATTATQCFCRNSGHFVTEVARCLKSNSTDAALSVYDTLVETCAGAATTLAVTEAEFLEAAEGGARRGGGALELLAGPDLRRRQSGTQQSGSSSGSSSSTSQGQSSQGQGTGSQTSSQTTSQSQSSPSQTSQNSAPQGETDGLPLGVKVGIIIGCVIGSLAIFVPLGFIILHRLKKRHLKKLQNRRADNGGSAENLTLNAVHVEPKPPSRGLSTRSGNMPTPSAYAPGLSRGDTVSTRTAPSVTASSQALPPSMMPPTALQMHQIPVTSSPTQYQYQSSWTSTAPSIISPLPLRTMPEVQDGTWAASIDTQVGGRTGISRTATWDTISPASAQTPHSQQSSQMFSSISEQQESPVARIRQPSIAELPGDPRSPVEADSRPIGPPTTITRQDSLSMPPPPRYSAHEFGGQTSR